MMNDVDYMYVAVCDAIMNLDTEARKRLASGADEDQALQVMVPRLLGAIESDGHVVRIGGMRSTIVVARKNGFQIVIDTDNVYVYFHVWWLKNLVLEGFVSSEGNGTHLGYRVSVTTWRRGPWQPTLFDVFLSDSYRLLNVKVVFKMSEVALALVDFLGMRTLPANGKICHW
jgi:hypothetical protein